jgi:hypothetical protein
MMHMLISYMLTLMEFMLGSNIGHDCMTITYYLILSVYVHRDFDSIRYK